MSEQPARPSPISGILLLTLRPTEETWNLIESWIPKAADAGQRFALADLMIGALTSEIDGLVWSLDADFERLAKLRLVSLYH